jgi:hypothetical protein
LVANREIIFFITLKNKVCHLWWRGCKQVVFNSFCYSSLHLFQLQSLHLWVICWYCVILLLLQNICCISLTHTLPAICRHQLLRQHLRLRARPPQWVLMMIWLQTSGLELILKQLPTRAERERIIS